MGVTVNNETSVIDLSEIGHLIIAGALGQGKSVLVNAIISSLLLQRKSDKIKFVLVDPKIVELGVYNRLPSQFFATVEDEEVYYSCILDHDSFLPTQHTIILGKKEIRVNPALSAIGRLQEFRSIIKNYSCSHIVSKKQLLQLTAHLTRFLWK